MTLATPFTIAQVTGPQRVIILKGRALPYRPVSFPRTQRVTTAYFPGNPKATQQVLGPTFEASTFNGTWKDKFLIRNDEQNGVDLLNFPPLAPGTLPQSRIASGGSFVGTNSFPGVQPAQLARVVVDAMELVVSEGQDVQIQWDQVVRYGKITRFEPRYGEPTGGISDIAWEFEFMPSGDREASPISRPVEFNILAAATGFQLLLDNILAVLRQLGGLRQPNAFLSAVGRLLGSIVEIVAALIDAFRSVLSVISAPSDLIGNIRGSLQEIRLLVRSFFADLNNLLSAPGGAARMGRAEDVQIASQVQQLLRARLQELAAFAAEQLRIAELFAAQEILATYFAESFTSLRDVAAQYYGDQAQWTVISEYNGFYSASVPRGTLVRVPVLN